MAQLLRIETQFVEVELHGRAGLPAALAALGSVLRAPHLSIRSSDDDYKAFVGDDGVPLSDDAHSPVLFEDEVYRLHVRSRVTGSRVQIVQRDPTVIRSVDHVADMITTATMSYARHIGLSDWVFRVGERELCVTLEVFPTKIDYASDYEALLDDLIRVKRALALEYFRATYRVGAVDRAQTGSGIEWLTLLRNHLTSLTLAIHHINREPRRNLRSERQITSLEKIRGPKPAVIAALGRGQGRGAPINLVGIGQVRSQIEVRRSHETLDTFEHRWLRARLRFVHARLLALGAEQEGRITRSKQRSGREPARLVAESAELTALTRIAAQLLEVPVILAATADVPASSSSLQLQTAIGYSEAYRILTALGAALGSTDRDEQFSVSDINDLYEAWCYVKVAELAAVLTGAEIDLSKTMSDDSDGLRFTLAKGASRRILLSWPTGSMSLAYNPQYAMPTGLQKPDIAVNVRLLEGSSAMFVLDAKYRIDASEEYVRQFGAPGAPIDAVNELHRYRDAIRTPQHAPAVTAGIALFPWPAPPTPEVYRLRRSIDEVGIGAISFLPGAESEVQRWLGTVLGINREP
jgi:hypothetical protein